MSSLFLKIDSGYNSGLDKYNINNYTLCVLYILIYIIYMYIKVHICVCIYIFLKNKLQPRKKLKSQALRIEIFLKHLFKSLQKKTVITLHRYIYIIVCKEKQKDSLFSKEKKWI